MKDAKPTSSIGNIELAVGVDNTHTGPAAHMALREATSEEDEREILIKEAEHLKSFELGLGLSPDPLFLAAFLHHVVVSVMALLEMHLCSRCFSSVG